MYPRQHYSGWGKVGRLIPHQNEDDPGEHVDRKSIKQFLEGCRQRGTSELTVTRYGKPLEVLYDYLPEDKSIRYGTLAKWRGALIDNGYIRGTVNSYVSVANMRFDFSRRCEYQMSERLGQMPEEQPALSRMEYLQLLQAARKGYTTEPIFQTRDGRPMNCAYTMRMIRAICPAAGVSEDKGGTRCLQKLYRSNRAGLESSLLTDQAHERLLEHEQLETGWNENNKAVVW